MGVQISTPYSSGLQNPTGIRPAFKGNRLPFYGQNPHCPFMAIRLPIAHKWQSLTGLPQSPTDRHRPPSPLATSPPLVANRHCLSLIVANRHPCSLPLVAHRHSFLSLLALLVIACATCHRLSLLITVYSPLSLLIVISYCTSPRPCTCHSSSLVIDFHPHRHSSISQYAFLTSSCSHL